MIGSKCDKPEKESTPVDAGLMAVETCADFIMDCLKIICENLGVGGPSDLLQGWCEVVGILANPRPAPMPDCY